MSRKILKVLISILFLIVAAVAAILSIKSFFPELLEQVKYGVKHIVGEPTKKTPAFKKDVQGNKIPLQDPFAEGRKYGVASVERTNPLNYQGGIYADEPVQRPPYREQGEKYGVSPVRGRDASLEPAKYGVGPIYKYNEQSNKN